MSDEQITIDVTPGNGSNNENVFNRFFKWLGNIMAKFVKIVVLIILAVLGVLAYSAYQNSSVDAPGIFGSGSPYDGRYDLILKDGEDEVVKLDFDVEGISASGSFGGETMTGALSGIDSDTARLTAKSESWKADLNLFNRNDRIRIQGTIKLINPGVLDRWFGTTTWSLDVTPGWR